MNQFRTIALCAFLVAANPATLLADIDAESFWSHWEQELTAPDSGITIGRVERTGTAVVLHDVKLVTSNDQMTYIGPIPQLVLSNADGGIEITLSKEFPFHTAFAQEVLADGITVEQLRETVGHILLPDATLRIDGDAPDNLTAVELTAPDVQAIIDKETLAGNLVDSALTVKLAGAKGRYSYGSKGSDHILELFATAATASVKGRKADPAVFQGEFTADGVLDGPTLNFTMTMPKDFLFDDTIWNSETVPVGALLKGGFAAAASTLNLDIPGKIKTGDDTLLGAGEVVLSLASQSTTLSGEMSDAEFAVLADIRAAGMALGGAGVPVPFEGQLAELRTDIRMPIAKSDTSSDFHWINRVIDLRLPDTMWDRADPGKRLPRDPINFELDLAGKGRSTYDWMARPAGEELADPPMLVDWLKLNALRLSGAGAELTGSGEGTFDTRSASTAIPIPTGKLNLRLVGGNALLESAGAMGFLNDDELLGARLGLGMIFKAGEGTDVQTSDIEANKAGQVTVNGMRLR